MANTFESGRRRRTGQPPLGRAERTYTATEGNNVPTDFTLPSSGIRDVDKALFNLFDVILNLQVNTRNEIKRVPVIFAGGERFSLTKSGRPIRDKKGAIIVPIISIHRTGVKIGADPDLGFNAGPGDITIRRKLDSSDRNYQSLLNKNNIKNQNNIASSRNAISPLGRVASRRQQENRSSTNANLVNSVGNNIIEIITAPAPTAMTLLYDITVWTSYTAEMNQLLETICTSYEIRLDSESGYWYVLYIDSDVTTDDNFTDYSSQKRFIRTKFTARVPMYLFAQQNPGDPSPFRRFLSAPTFEFAITDGALNAESLAVQMPMLGPENNAFMLSNVEDVQIDGRVNASDDRNASYIQDPFGSSEHTYINPRYARVIYRSSKGERISRISNNENIDTITNI